jgi:hypothetical protein
MLFYSEIKNSESNDTILPPYRCQTEELLVPEVARRSPGSCCCSSAFGIEPAATVVVLERLRPLLTLGLAAPLGLAA